MPAGRRRRRGLVSTPLGAINLVPLLDIMCNLLIVLMIVAPTLKSGITLDLPTVTDSKIITPRKSYTISIAKPDQPDMPPRIYLEDRRVDLDQLRTELESFKARYAPDLDILIECDRLVSCETMLRVLGVTQAVGLESVGVVTLQQEPVKK